MLDPVSVALKFGFLAVLYLFLAWVVRSSLRDLRRTGDAAVAGDAPVAEQGTGLHSATTGLAPGRPGRAHRLRVRSAQGLEAGSVYDLGEGATLGRGDQADIRLQDSFASSRHARLEPHGDLIVLEDLGSTNGTLLNGEPLRGPQPLHAGDRIRIGDCEFSYELAGAPVAPR